MGALRRKLTRAGLPGLLVTHPPDIRYLCGFTGSSAALAVTRRTARLFTDGRYTAQAAEEVKAAQVQIVQGRPGDCGGAVAGRAAGRGPWRASTRRAPRWRNWRVGRAELPSRLRRGFFQAIPAPLSKSCAA